MKEILYPDRQRCKTCRKAFTNVVLDGLYDSYECAGIKIPSRDINLAPRHCKRLVDGVWGWKTKFTYEGKIPQKLRDDPGTNIYRCDYCHYLHVGHSRVAEFKSEKLQRTVADPKTLGSVIKRYREQQNIDKKFLAKTLKVPAIRITEIEEGSPKMNVDILFAILYRLRINLELSGR